MVNLPGILGTMLATGMAGRSRRGPAFAASPFGIGGSGRSMGIGSRRGSFRQAAGIASLGYLAYKAYQEHQRNSRANPESAPAGPAASDDGSLGERLAGLLRPEQRAKPEAALGDQKALLLIRAMIAAANADGEISADERRRILSRLDAAGASAEDHRFVEMELAAPQPLDVLLRDIPDEETAEQVYLASAMAIEPDSAAERSYFDYLAARLNLDPQQAQELRAAVQD